ncbi:hypothetical protein AMTRI_Chr08g207970 [Amborella trichopoda]
MRPLLRYYAKKAFSLLKSLSSLISEALHRFAECPFEMAENRNSSPLAPPFDPKKPATPISFPIPNLEDLENRSYFESFHFPFNKSSVPLQKSSSGSLPRRPRILVCHDMDGGYLDDKWIQGGSNGDAYAIWHWHLIDVFVYFSHNLVTLPPPCWTNAAHTHGVKVLGTFITEWDEGRAVANTLLATPESSRMYADRLAEIAVELGFDGWLINMEVALDVKQIPNLKEFVDYLTRSMHSLAPGSLVIWYDSVTKDGILSWQNQLNDLNKPFFDLCDGIFVNYSWQEDYPKSSAAVAGSRNFDVYMGVDVFGRGTYGGGQWTTNVALEVAKKDAISAAIFAPGWVYQTKQGPDFETAQNRWWGLIEKSWGICQNYPIQLPFFSNFDQGHGQHFFIEGQPVLADPWCNISSQGFQPLLEDGTGKRMQVFVNFKDPAYNGGGHITIEGNLEKNNTFLTRLFHGELTLSDLPIHVSYHVKTNGTSTLSMALQFSSTLKGRTTFLLTPVGTSIPNENSIGEDFLGFPPGFGKIKKLPITKTRVRVTDWTLYESTFNMDGYLLTDIHAVCHNGNPDDDRIIKDPNPSLSNEISEPNLELPSYSASLGRLSIKTTEQKPGFPPSSAWVFESEDISWTKTPDGIKTLSVKLIWRLKERSDLVFLRYNIYAEKLVRGIGEDHIGVGVAGAEEYLGFARVEAFYVSEMPVPQGIGALKFLLQVTGMDGACQEVADAPSLVLEVAE